MTDRFNTLTVVLERNMRDDDAESLIQAIQMLRGVAAVAGDVANSETYMATERARLELRQKLWDALK
jgi:hypothetical protein